MYKGKGIKSSCQRQRQRGQSHRRWILTFPSRQYWHQQRKSLDTFLNKPIIILDSRIEEEDGPIKVVYQWNKGLKAEDVKQKLGDDNIGILLNTFEGRPGIRPNSPSPPPRNVFEPNGIVIEEDFKMEAPDFGPDARAITTILDCNRMSTTTNPSLNASSIVACSTAVSQISSTEIDHDNIDANKEELNYVENIYKTSNSFNQPQSQTNQLPLIARQDQIQAHQNNTENNDDELHFQSWVAALEQGTSLDNIKKIAVTSNKIKLFFDRKKILETVIIDLNTQRYIQSSLLPRYKQRLQGQRQTLQDQKQNCLHDLLEEQLNKGNKFVFNILYENKDELS